MSREVEYKEIVDIFKELINMGFNELYKQGLPAICDSPSSKKCRKALCKYYMECLELRILKLHEKKKTLGTIVKELDYTQWDDLVILYFVWETLTKNGVTFSDRQIRYAYNIFYDADIHGEKQLINAFFHAKENSSKKGQ